MFLDNNIVARKQQYEPAKLILKKKPVGGGAGAYNWKLFQKYPEEFDLGYGGDSLSTKHHNQQQKEEDQKIQEN